MSDLDGFEIDEQLQEEVFELSKNLIKYSEVYRGFKNFKCPGMKNFTGNLLIDYWQAFSEGFRLFSLFETIVKHIQCKWSVKIRFIFNYNDYYYKDTFIMDPLAIEGDTTVYEQGYLVPLEETFMVEILTASKVVKKQVYFSFMYLFSYIVWLCLFLSIICVGILWQVSTDSRITLRRGITDLVRGLTSQCSNSTRLWTSIRNSQTDRFSKWIIFQTLLYIWVIVSAFLSKSMSSVLLQTYIDTDVQPIVNSLLGIIRNDGIHVEGSELLEMVQNETSAKLWELLRAKIKGNKKMSRGAKTLNTTKELRAIISGKMIQLDNSKNNREKMLMYPNLPLTVGKRKYADTLFAFFVNKKAFLAKNITKLLKHAIEFGFDEHQKMCEDLKSRIKGRIYKKRMGKKFEILQNEHNIQRTAFTLKLDDLSHGLLLLLALGYVIAIIALVYESVAYYVENVYFSIDGLKLKDLDNYTLTEGFRIETHMYDEVILKFKRLSIENQEKLHRCLEQNYHLYFTSDKYVNNIDK